MSTQDEYKKKSVHKLVDRDRNIKKVIIPHSTQVGKKTNSVNKDTISKTSGSSYLATLTIRDDTQSWNRLELNNGNASGGNSLKFCSGGEKKASIYSYNTGDLIIKNEVDDIYLSTSDDIYFQPGKSTKMFLNDSGYLGIGTTSPASELEVVGTVTIDCANGETDYGLEIEKSGGSSALMIKLTNEDASETAAPSWGIFHQDDGDFTIGEAYNDYKFHIQNDGGIGINTSTPEGLLSLNASDGTTRPGIFLDGFGSTELDIAVDGGEQMQLGEWDGSSATLNAKIAANGDWYTNDGTTHNLSDRRLKDNIETLESCLEPILNLRPVTFNFNGMGQTRVDTGQQLGFIAQEVELVLPNIVGTDRRACDGGDECEIDGCSIYKSMSTGKLIPYLVGAIQELEKRVKELEDK